MTETETISYLMDNDHLYEINPQPDNHLADYFRNQEKSLTLDWDFDIDQINSRSIDR